MTAEEFKAALNGNDSHEYPGNIKVHVGKHDYWLHCDQLETAFDEQIGAMVHGFYVTPKPEPRGLIKGRRQYNFFYLKNATLVEEAPKLKPTWVIVCEENAWGKQFLGEVFPLEKPAEWSWRGLSFAHRFATKEEAEAVIAKQGCGKAVLRSRFDRKEAWVINREAAGKI